MMVTLQQHEFEPLVLSLSHTHSHTHTHARVAQPRQKNPNFTSRSAAVSILGQTHLSFYTSLLYVISQIALPFENVLMSDHHTFLLQHSMRVAVSVNSVGLCGAKEA